MRSRSACWWVYPLLIALVVAAGVSAQAFAVQPDEVLPDPSLEARARTLSRELRCMVCQNQSIDDSDAPLARDLRLLVRERLRAGDSDRQVFDFLMARYGEFVLLRPQLGWRTVALWAAPFVALLAGLLMIGFSWRRRPSASAATRLAPEEEQRLKEISGKS